MARSEHGDPPGGFAARLAAVLLAAVAATADVEHCRAAAAAALPEAVIAAAHGA